MLKAFCDCCGDECDGRNSKTRHLPSIKMRLGLEVILLFDQATAADRHVCDNCFADLLLNAATRFTKAPVVVSFNEAQALAFEFKRSREKLNGLLRLVMSDSDQVESVLAEAKLCLEELKQFPRADHEKIRLLEAKVQSLSSTEEQKRRRDLAAKIQEEVDINEYPEYTERVARRELLRSS